MTNPKGIHRFGRCPVCRMLINLCLCSLCFSLFLSACRDEKTVYSSFTDIPSAGLGVDEYCEFQTAEYDSAMFDNPAMHYNIVLAVRHTDSYPYTTVRLLVDQPDALVKVVPDTVILPVAASTGEWLANNRKGTYLVTDTLARNVALPPLFSLRVRQDMGVPQLKGLLDIGIIISRCDK